MATVLIDGDTLHVELKGIDVFWAVHGSFHIPLANIAGASTTKPPGFWDALKVIGTNAGSIKTAGTFVYHGETVFFDYSGHDDVLVVDLTGGTYKHMFVHVDAPDTATAAAQRITAAVAARSGSTA